MNKTTKDRRKQINLTFGVSHINQQRSWDMSTFTSNAGTQERGSLICDKTECMCNNVCNYKKRYANPNNIWNN